MPGHDHHPQASNVHRKLDIMGGRALLEGEGAEELHHGIEAVVLPGRTDILLVATDAEPRTNGTATEAIDLVIEVPGLHA